jgi:3-oxoacyl-[acyl-carrier protein] reductase
MNLDLNNKYALVCGSTAGIGKATALALAEEGVQVTLIARNENKLKATLTELPQHRNHDYIVADFSNPKELKEKVEAYIKDNHGFHVLVNNTGGPKGGPVFSAAVDEFEAAFTQHLKCNHVLAQAVVPFMKSEGFGRIIKVNSTSVKQP